MLLAMLCFLGGARATEVEIGDGGATNNSYLPGYNYYKYSLTQQIYTADEIGMAGTINSISFKNTGAEKTRTYSIYMLLTEKETFENGTDWVAMSDDDLVFSGELTFAVGEWTTIDIDTPFAYDGTSNLIVGVADVTGDYSTSPHMACLVFNATSQAIYAYRDGSAYDITTPGVTGTVLNVKNQIKLDITPSSGSTCIKPSTFEVSNITTSSANFEWENTGAGSYTFEYKKASDSDWTVVPDLTSYTYSLSTLASGTAYKARVKAVCGTDLESVYKSTNFTTECGAISSFPWSENFESYSTGDFTAPCWVNEHISGDGNSIFAISTHVNGTNSTHQLQFPDQSNGTLTKLVLPLMTLPTENYAFVLDVYRSGFYSMKTGEGIRVYASTNGEIEGAAELAFIPRVMSVSNDVIPAESAAGWYTYELPIGISGNCFIILRGESQDGQATYMDNFLVREASTCAKPTSFAASDVTAHTVNLSWTSEATSWVVAYKAADAENFTEVNVTENPYTLTGLDGETAYSVKVRTDCGSGNYSDWTNPVSFTTTIACPQPTNVTVSNITGHRVTITWDEVEGAMYQCAMVKTAEYNVENITWSESFDTNTQSWNNLDPETSYTFALRKDCSSAEDGYSQIVTKTFTTTVACPAPTGLKTTLTPGDGTVATLSWTEPGDANEWVLQYGTDATFTHVISVNISDNPSANLTGLTAETTYYARVKAVCGGEDGESQWSSTVTFTPTNEYTITVNDGTNTNRSVPIYGYWADKFSKSQFIIPATDLTAMQNGSINKLTFYASNTIVSWGNAEFEVYMTEVNKTTFDDATLIDWATMDKVMNAGSLSISDNKMEVELDEEYQYMGGNLLIGILQTTKGTYSSCYWYGVSSEDNVAIGGYESSKAIEIQNFLPKTTFDFTPGTASSCPKPQNLTATNIGSTSATLSWEGTSDSYVLQYRTAAQDMNMSVWNQYGDDIAAPGEFTQLTFDLSAYSGTGNIAIRHYACSGQWQMSIDDIVVTNADDETVVNETFDSGSIPSGWENLDYDGDGLSWQIVNFGSDANCQHGAYCLLSRSFYNNEDLNPDNWLIIPNVELGGTLSFYVASTDADWLENFGVFVTTESYAAVPAGEWSADITTEETSCQLTGLTANTPYEWRVKGICDPDEESSWATSNFITISEGFKTFVTSGDWNVADNWFPTGVPTITDEVRIEAEVTILAGMLAQAKKASIGTGGSILIKDGGQLKQGSSTLKVTMEKGIGGYYGSTNNDYYNFIATPLTGTTKLGYNLGWNYVLDVNSEDYDFYSFDASQEEEWQNYEALTDASNFVMNPGQGYLYANQNDKTLEFKGITPSSVNNTITANVTYASSSDPFNGWKLIGNPFSCNGYVSYSGNATFYKMNAAGNGFVAYKNGVVLAPGEGAFIKVYASGTITYSSEVPASIPDGSIATGLLPILPLHGLETDQDADLSTTTTITFAKEGYATYYNGVCDVVLPAGMKAHAVSAGGTSLTYAGVADGDSYENVIPAGTAVLLQVEAAESVQTIPVYLITPSADPYAGTNFLFGSDEARETYGGAKYYKLTYSDNNDNFGWYWGAANGGAFISPAHKAWLALPASAPSFLGLPGWEDTTGIVPVGVNSEDGEWYTLQGLKIGKKPTTAGVYIHNGRKVLIP